MTLGLSRGHNRPSFFFGGLIDLMVWLCLELKFILSLKLKVSQLTQYCAAAPPLINISRELRWIQTAIRLRFEFHTRLGSSGHGSTILTGSGRVTGAKWSRNAPERRSATFWTPERSRTSWRYSCGVCKMRHFKVRQITKNVAGRCDFPAQNTPKCILAGASPRTPLGELTALSQSP